MDLYDRGMREPLPLACMASAAYADAAASGRDADAAARKAWQSAWNYPKEDAELEHQLVLGGVRTFEAAFASTPFNATCSYSAASAEDPFRTSAS